MSTKFNILSRGVLSRVQEKNRVRVEYLFNLVQSSVMACSIRKLDVNSIFCMKVRRSSDDATQDIGFVGQELDISSLESFCSGGDGFVNVWYGQGSSASDYSQATNSYQPKIVDTGSVIRINGEPSLLFDGVDDILSTGNGWNNEYMYFGVHKIQSIPSGRNNLFGPAGGGSVIPYIYSDDHWWVDYTGRTNRIIDLSNPLNLTQETISVMVNTLTGTQQKLYFHINNTQLLYTESKTVNNGGNSSYIGGIATNVGSPAIQPWDGYIQEAICYDYWDYDFFTRESNREIITNNQNDYWNVY